MEKYISTKEIIAEQFKVSEQEAKNISETGADMKHNGIVVRKGGDEFFGVSNSENGFSRIEVGEYIIYNEDGSIKGKMAKDEFEATHTKVAEPVAPVIAPVEEAHEETKAE